MDSRTRAGDGGARQPSQPGGTRGVDSESGARTAEDCQKTGRGATSATAPTTPTSNPEPSAKSNERTGNIRRQVQGPGDHVRVSGPRSPADDNEGVGDVESKGIAGVAGTVEPDEPDKSTESDQRRAGKRAVQGQLISACGAAQGSRDSSSGNARAGHTTTPTATRLRCATNWHHETQDDEAICRSRHFWWCGDA